MSKEKDKTILDLTELTSVDGTNDFIPIVDQSSNETKKVSPSNLPVSTAQQAELDLKADDADLTAHANSTSNPHGVTAAQVGLGNVDNTSDASKPVSTAQQAVLDLKADDADLTAHANSTSNPHGVTAAQVGLGNVDNTSDASKPVSTAQQTALDLKADDADLTAHTDSTSNPHSVTAAQVGLGNVDNTSDASKPVSTAQQTALDLKADATALTTETNARIDADNRREFAGGVYCDGSAGLNNSIITILDESNDFTLNEKILVFNFNLTGSNNVSNEGIFSKRSVNVGGYECALNAQGEIVFIAFKTGSNNVFLSNKTTITGLNDGKTYKITIVADFTNPSNAEIVFYVNGVLSDTTVTTAPNGTYGDASLNTNLSLGYTVGFGKLTGSVSDVAIFNTALTATQAAELYQQGLQPWLAANPEYRRAQDLTTLDAEDNSTSGWVILDASTGSTSNVSIESSNPITGSYSYKFANTTTGTNGNYPRFRKQSLGFNFSVGNTYDIKCKLKLISGSAAVKGNIGTGTGTNTQFLNTTTLTLNNVLEVNSTITPTNIVGIQNAIEFIFNGTLGAFEVLCDDIEITQLGSLATLPLDDERSLLRDISGNNNHATASDTGVTHLKSSPVTLETVDTLVDADNRREFAGGVYCDGNDLGRIATTVIQNQISSNPFTLYFKGRIDGSTKNAHGNNIIGNAKGIGSYTAGNFGLVYRNAITDIRFESEISSSSVVATETISINTNEELELLCTVDPSTERVIIYKNGIEEVNEIVTGLDLSAAGTVNIFGNRQNFAPETYPHIIGVARSAAIFNTALTATQAAELYQQGLQPWLAANPEYRRGLIISNGIDDGQWNGNSNAGSTISGTTLTSTAINTFGPYLTQGNTLQPNTNYRINYSFTSSDVNQYVFRNTVTHIPTFSGASIIQTVDGYNATGTFDFTTTDNVGLFITATPSSVGDSYSLDIEITQIGSLATLPLDDDCRQLKDISGNRNDATASESGVTHLKEKDLHAFRDDNADGTGGSYLIANADILAENEIITGVVVDGRFYASSGAQDLTKRRIKLQDHGSHVDVKRSNGTTDDAAIAVTNPSDGTDFAISVLTQRI